MAAAVWKGGHFTMDHGGVTEGFYCYIMRRNFLLLAEFRLVVPMRELVSSGESLSNLHYT